MASKAVTFDDSGKIRVLSGQEYEESLRLKDDCHDFVSSTHHSTSFCPSLLANPCVTIAEVSNFHTLVNTILTAVEEKAKVIEKEKLRVTVSCAPFHYASELNLILTLPRLSGFETEWSQRSKIETDGSNNCSPL